jgi:hypothetical protein
MPPKKTGEGVIQQEGRGGQGNQQPPKNEGESDVENSSVNGNGTNNGNMGLNGNSSASVLGGGSSSSSSSATTSVTAHVGAGAATTAVSRMGNGQEEASTAHIAVLMGMSDLSRWYHDMCAFGQAGGARTTQVIDLWGTLPRIAAQIKDKTTLITLLDTLVKWIHATHDGQMQYPDGGPGQQAYIPPDLPELYAFVMANPFAGFVISRWTTAKLKSTIHSYLEATNKDVKDIFMGIMKRYRWPPINTYGNAVQFFHLKEMMEHFYRKVMEELANHAEQVEESRITFGLYAMFHMFGQTETGVCQWTFTTINQPLDFLDPNVDPETGIPRNEGINSLNRMSLWLQKIARGSKYGYEDTRTELDAIRRQLVTGFLAARAAEDKQASRHDKKATRTKDNGAKVANGHTHAESSMDTTTVGAGSGAAEKLIYDMTPARYKEYLATFCKRCWGYGHEAKDCTHPVQVTGTDPLCPTCRRIPNKKFHHDKHSCSSWLKWAKENPDKAKLSEERDKNFKKNQGVNQGGGATPQRGAVSK